MKQSTIVCIIYGSNTKYYFLFTFSKRSSCFGGTIPISLVQMGIGVLKFTDASLHYPAKPVLTRGSMAVNIC